MKWRGRYGYVALGPTEDRVARYLEAATRHGRVVLPTRRLVADLNLARSEAYRITRRLRVLGLFGIENDQGGAKGGRRVWRTSTPDGSRLDAVAHRLAWARVAGAARALRARILARLRKSNERGIVTARAHAAKQPAPAIAGRTPRAGAGPPSPFLEAMLRYAPGLAHEWRLTDAT